eukprot:tig00000767_g3971.t1
MRRIPLGPRARAARALAGPAAAAAPAAQQLREEEAGAPWLRFSIEGPPASPTTSASTCTVPVTLSVKNCSSGVPVALLVEALGPDEPASAAAPGPGGAATSGLAAATAGADAAGSECLWLGPTRVHVDSLPPGGVHSTAAAACLFAPGVANLNRFRVTAVPPAPAAPVVYPVSTLLSHLVSVSAPAPLLPAPTARAH